MTFGDFEAICKRAPLPLCTLINPLNKDLSEVVFTGVLPKCYARSVNLANTLIFEIGTAFINIANLVILLLIIYFVRQRYTSVARKEMLFFFWCLILHTISLLIVDTGVSPPGSTTYGYFVSLELAVSAAACWSLLYAGVSSLNFWDDGSSKTMLMLYLSSFVVFCINYLISICTFKGWGGTLNASATTALYTFYFVLNPILLAVWLLTQCFICTFTIVFNWWALGALGLATFFFLASQSLIYAFSDVICTHINHYSDGTVFSSVSKMLCFMMVYKYWDIITFDDDEYYRHTEMVHGVDLKDEVNNMLN